jgi:hypothetical protein
MHHPTHPRGSILAILALATAVGLVGCGPSQTRTEFEGDHEYAKIISEIPAQSADQLTVVIYSDFQPRIDFHGVYHPCPGQHVLAYDNQNRVQARTWQSGE